MAEIRKIEIQDSNGNTYYPKNTGETTFLSSGKTLQDFFDNGGTLGGDLTVKKNDGGTFISSERGNLKASFGVGSIENLILVLTDITTNEYCSLNLTKETFEPSYGFSPSLGNSERRFKDLYIGKYNRGENGYVKLANEIIMQWGVITLSTTAQNFNFPISFPSMCRAVMLTAVGGEAGIGKVTAKNTNYFKAYQTGVTTSNTFTFLAIGY